MSALLWTMAGKLGLRNRQGSLSNAPGGKPAPCRLRVFHHSPRRQEYAGGLATSARADNALSVGHNILLQYGVILAMFGGCRFAASQTADKNIPGSLERAIGASAQHFIS